MALSSGPVFAQSNCDDLLASNYNMGDGACTYCDSTNELNSSPEEEFTIGSGNIPNDHMNVGIDLRAMGSPRRWVCMNDTLQSITRQRRAI